MKNREIFNPIQNEILQTVFRSMDREFGICTLTEEQLKEFNLKLDEVSHEVD